MWRTVIINRGERIKIKDNWLVVEGGGMPDKVPINELYSVIVDNRQSSLTVAALNKLTENGIHILICNDKHIPESLIIPFNTHYRPYNVMKKQIAMTDEFKNLLWQKVTIAKIANQAEVLKLQDGEANIYEHLIKFCSEVEIGDKTNREGLAAKMFFRHLYGSEFVRMADDAINSALNYGYAIIRSAIARTLCAYGYCCVLGIHHISESNAYNLADDLMEPFRPLVDLWVDSHREDLYEELTVNNRKCLANLMNVSIELSGKNMAVRNAIDKYISSFTTAVNKNDETKLILPKITRKTKEWSGYEDGE